MSTEERKRIALWGTWSGYKQTFFPRLSEYLLAILQYLVENQKTVPDDIEFDGKGIRKLEIYKQYAIKGRKLSEDFTEPTRPYVVCIDRIRRESFSGLDILVWGDSARPDDKLPLDISVNIWDFLVKCSGIFVIIPVMPDNLDRTVYLRKYAEFIRRYFSRQGSIDQELLSGIRFAYCVVHNQTIKEPQTEAYKKAFDRFGVRDSRNFDFLPPVQRPRQGNVFHIRPYSVEEAHAPRDLGHWHEVMPPFEYMMDRLLGKEETVPEAVMDEPWSPDGEAATLVTSEATLLDQALARHEPDKTPEDTIAMASVASAQEGDTKPINRDEPPTTGEDTIVNQAQAEPPPSSEVEQRADRAASAPDDQNGTSGPAPLPRKKFETETGAGSRVTGSRALKEPPAAPPPVPPPVRAVYPLPQVGKTPFVVFVYGKAVYEKESPVRDSGWGLVAFSSDPRHDRAWMERMASKYRLIETGDPRVRRVDIYARGIFREFSSADGTRRVETLIADAQLSSRHDAEDRHIVMKRYLITPTDFSSIASMDPVPLLSLLRRVHLFLPEKFDESNPYPPHVTPSSFRPRTQADAERSSLEAVEFCLDNYSAPILLQIIGLLLNGKRVLIDLEQDWDPDTDADKLFNDPAVKVIQAALALLPPYFRELLSIAVGHVDPKCAAAELIAAPESWVSSYPNAYWFKRRAKRFYPDVPAWLKGDPTQDGSRLYLQLLAALLAADADARRIGLVALGQGAFEADRMKVIVGHVEAIRASSDLPAASLELENKCLAPDFAKELRKYQKSALGEQVGQTLTRIRAAVGSATPEVEDQGNDFQELVRTAARETTKPLLDFCKKITDSPERYAHEFCQVLDEPGIWESLMDRNLLDALEALPLWQQPELQQKFAVKGGSSLEDERPNFGQIRRYLAHFTQALPIISFLDDVLRTRLLDPSDALILIANHLAQLLDFSPTSNAEVVTTLFLDRVPNRDLQRWLSRYWQTRTGDADETDRNIMNQALEQLLLIPGLRLSPAEQEALYQHFSVPIDDSESAGDQTEGDSMSDDDNSQDDVEDEDSDQPDPAALAHREKLPVRLVENSRMLPQFYILLLREIPLVLQNPNLAPENRWQILPPAIEDPAAREIRGVVVEFFSTAVRGKALAAAELFRFVLDRMEALASEQAQEMEKLGAVVFGWLLHLIVPGESPDPQTEALQLCVTYWLDSLYRQDLPPSDLSSFPRFSHLETQLTSSGARSSPKRLMISDLLRPLTADLPFDQQLKALGVLQSYLVDPSAVMRLHFYDQIVPFGKEIKKSLSNVERLDILTRILPIALEGLDDTLRLALRRSRLQAYLKRSVRSTQQETQTTISMEDFVSRDAQARIVWLTPYIAAYEKDMRSGRYQPQPEVPLKLLDTVVANGDGTAEVLASRRTILWLEYLSALPDTPQANELIAWWAEKSYTVRWLAANRPDVHRCLTSWDGFPTDAPRRLQTVRAWLERGHKPEEKTVFFIPFDYYATGLTRSGGIDPESSRYQRSLLVLLSEMLTAPPDLRSREQLKESRVYELATKTPGIRALSSLYALIWTARGTGDDLRSLPVYQEAVNESGSLGSEAILAQWFGEDQSESPSESAVEPID